MVILKTIYVEVLRTLDFSKLEWKYSKTLLGEPKDYWLVRKRDKTTEKCRKSKTIFNNSENY